MNMKDENIIDILTKSIIYYYSLFKRFDVTDNLICGINDSISKMWIDYTSDIDDKDISIIFTFDELMHVNDNNLYGNITQEIISYFTKGNMVESNNEIFTLFTYKYLPGMSITHAQISKIIEFYLK